jgi:hypothetical protein
MSIALNPAPLPGAPVRRRRRWLPVLGVALAVLLLAAGLLVAALLSSVPSAPLHISIDGQELVHGWDPSQLPAAHQVVLVALLMFALLAALVVVPLALSFALVAIVGAALLAVGLPLIVALLGVALALSPLILLLWGLWKLVS